MITFGFGIGFSLQVDQYLTIMYSNTRAHNINSKILDINLAEAREELAIVLRREVIAFKMDVRLR